MDIKTIEDLQKVSVEGRTINVEERKLQLMMKAIEFDYDNSKAEILRARLYKILMELHKKHAEINEILNPDIKFHKG